MKIWVFAPIQAIVAGVEVWFPLASGECAREGEGWDDQQHEGKNADKTL